MRSDPLDALDELVKPDARPLPDDHTQIMVVPGRFATPQEADEYERAWLHSRKLGSGASWVIPFCDDDGNVMLTEGEAEQLEKIFGITASEYKELFRWSPK